MVHKYFAGGNFSLITSHEKNTRNNCLTVDVTRAIAPMEDELEIELCMRRYHVYSEVTAGEELLCEREPRNTKDSSCYA